MRSPHNRHRTGCVIRFQGEIIAKGCSYKHDGFLKVNSIHAERHALSHMGIHTYAGFANAIIVTLTKVNNFANNSRPCADCARALQAKGISVTYAERTNDGGWAIRYVPFDLLTEGYLKPTKYAEKS
jgi:cytidine deaminase